MSFLLKSFISSPKNLLISSQIRNLSVSAIARCTEKPEEAVKTVNPEKDRSKEIPVVSSYFNLFFPTLKSICFSRRPASDI